MSCVHFQSILHSILVDQVVEAIDSVWTLSRTQQIHRNKEVLGIYFQQFIHNKEMIMVIVSPESISSEDKSELWKEDSESWVPPPQPEAHWMEILWGKLQNLKYWVSHVNWSLDKGFWGRGHDIRKVLIRVVEVPLGELVEVAVGVRWEGVVVLNHPENSR